MALPISRTIETENWVLEPVVSGRHDSFYGAIPDALLLFETSQSEKAVHLSSLKSDIAAGLADADVGRISVLDIAAIKAQGRAALQARTAK